MAVQSFPRGEHVIEFPCKVDHGIRRLDFSSDQATSALMPQLARVMYGAETRPTAVSLQPLEACWQSTYWCQGGYEKSRPVSSSFVT